MKRTSILTVLLFTPVMILAAPRERPNIVLILADDLGYGDLSCYGATKVRTPAVDRLAEEGMRFTDAHSPHSVCTPTRYSLLTGRYAWRTWAKHRCVWSNDPLLIDTDRLTVPKLLGSVGYRTACIGKWHLGFGSPESPGWDPIRGPDYNRPLKPGPNEVGFDDFFGIPHVGQHPHVYIENDRVLGLSEDSRVRIVLDERQRDRRSYLDRRAITPWHTFTGLEGATYEHEDLAVDLTERAVKWLKEYDRDGPFFLYFALRNVHAPLRPHPRFKGSEIGRYGDFIAELDWSVGRVLDTLDELKVKGKTLVILSSDNGAVQKGHRPARIVDYAGHRANGPFRGQKTEVYEGGHRVPLVVRWPGRVKAGTTNDHLVALTDVLATLADWFGTPLPEDAGEDSFSFLHSLLGTRPTGPVRTGLVMDSNGGCFAVRDGDWKLLLCQGGGGLGWSPRDRDETRPAGQLYNLADDPAEKRNLYEDRPGVVGRLTALLTRQQRAGRTRPLPRGAAAEGPGRSSTRETRRNDARQHRE